MTGISPPRRRPRALRRRAVASAAVLVLSGAGAAAASGAATALPGAASGDGFSPTATAQLTALQDVKASATPAERKLDSHLLLAERRRSDPRLAAALPHLDLGLTVTKAGTTTVDLSVTSVAPDLAARLVGVGATVTATWTSARVLRVVAPLGSLTTIASWSDVRHVAPPAVARSSSARPESARSTAPSTPRAPPTGS